MMAKTLSIFLIMAALQSCITTNTNPRPRSRAQKIINCVKGFSWEDALFFEKVKSCTDIYRQGVSGDTRHAGKK